MLTGLQSIHGPDYRSSDGLAVDYLVHDAFNISDHSIVVTVAGFGSVSGGNRRLGRDPMAQAKLDHGNAAASYGSSKTK